MVWGEVYYFALKVYMYNVVWLNYRPIFLCCNWIVVVMCYAFYCLGKFQPDVEYVIYFKSIFLRI